MALICKTCGHATGNRKNLYCRPCSKKVLRKLEQVGYLEPLTLTTVDGVQKLSNERFLTLQDGVPKTEN